ncbi:flagellar basal body rod protein FlgB [Halanaerocella petrolearia]
MKLFDQNFSVLQKSLDGLQKRHKTIANNISNADTPGYKRKGVSFKGQLNKVLNQDYDLEVTNKRHISLNSRSLESVKPKMYTEEDTKVRSDGNNVSIDAEMSKLAKTNLEYQAVTKQLANKFRRIENVIKKGGK